MRRQGRAACGWLTLVEWQGRRAGHRVHFRRLGERHLPHRLDVLHHPVSHQQDTRVVLSGLRPPIRGLQAAEDVELLKLELHSAKGWCEAVSILQTRACCTQETDGGNSRCQGFDVTIFRLENSIQVQLGPLQLCHPRLSSRNFVCTFNLKNGDNTRGRIVLPDYVQGLSLWETQRLLSGWNRWAPPLGCQQRPRRVVRGSSRGSPRGSVAEAPWPISANTTRLWSWWRRIAPRSHHRLRDRGRHGDEARDVWPPCQRECTQAESTGCESTRAHEEEEEAMG
jgi:hypothetical protein